MDSEPYFFPLWLKNTNDLMMVRGDVLASVINCQNGEYAQVSSYKNGSLMARSGGLSIIVDGEASMKNKQALNNAIFTDPTTNFDHWVRGVECSHF